METKKQEASLADTIVQGATGTPSASESRVATKGLMAKAGAAAEQTLVEGEADMQEYVAMMARTIRDTRDVTTNPEMESSETSDTNINSLSSFVQQFEGYSPVAYWDNKQWSIGYGTKASGEGATITKEQAKADHERDLAKARNTVVAHQKKHGYDWAPHQVDALSAFTYNLGAGGLRQLTDGGLRGDEEISSMILEYNRAGGKKSPGLVKRRVAEAKLFTQGYD